MAVLDRRIPLILTGGIAAEYQDVLSRPSVRKLTGLTVKQNTEVDWRVQTTGGWLSIPQLTENTYFEIQSGAHSWEIL